ncbi:MAG: methylenetetrahydrofolate dehydrogenase [Oscillospiraceae bacterium]
MKARIPKHREFAIKINDEEEPRHEECWAKLMEIMEDYKKLGKSVYTDSFIEDNEAKVKALQEEYKFTYTIEEK